MTNDPKILTLALLGGIIPSLLWLWFWLKEEETSPEPKDLITLVFILGMVAVLLVLPIQRFIQMIVDSNELQIILWAATEELVKFIAVMAVLYKTNHVEQPVDWPIYFITVALGFAALENTMFLIKPLSLGQTTTGLLTGQLRFLGSTLLHSISSGIIGMALGLSFYLDGVKKKLYVIIGIIFAIGLHSTFNFFIMNNNGSDFLKVLAFLWVVTIIIMLLFEKLRRMSKEN